ncbi:hypothetical protein KVT40_001835 [Elsinoe batatas]|uniref:Uncharacterized protein n=1 Tax=Elsinoe batatas TaxID=2601811 RepID=A0A8K0L9F1_9PEZI|nr:hypothetical protein KVT40_001835 [Elsinoe batatas]
MRSFVLLSLAVAALASPAPAPGPVAPKGKASEVIPGSYIVKLKDTSSKEAVTSFLGRKSFRRKTPRRTYQAANFKGFATELSVTEKAQLEQDSTVESIEPDHWLYINGVVNQASATWGLAKLSQGRGIASDYQYDETAGAGTCSYIVDTGVYTAHPDFGGRASFGVSYETTDGTNTDDHGHGTHVAGTVGSSTYGVAKKTQVVAVKVCNKNGGCRASDVIAGLQWVVNDRVARNCSMGAVVNLSLGTTSSEWTSVRDAVTTLTNAGVFVAVAAGNSGVDAANSYPASAPNACTVGATDSTDKLASFSNFGAVVDILAPGVYITSLSNSGNGTAIMSGTSMASPHIAGLAAYFNGLMRVRPTPVQLCDIMKILSVVNKVKSVPRGTFNRLAYNAL